MSELQNVVTRNTKVLIALRGIDGYKELATMLGVDATTISQKMRGVRKWSLEDIGKLAVAFKMPPGNFLGEVHSIVDPNQIGTGTTGATNWKYSPHRLPHYVPLPLVTDGTGDIYPLAAVIPINRHRDAESRRPPTSRRGGLTGHRLIG